MNRFDFTGVSTEGFAQSKEIEAAFDGFTRHGYVILDSVLPAETVRSLHAEFFRDYKDRIRDQ